MGDLSSRPRTTPMAGHRGATSIYCATCRRFHETHRGLNPERCPVEGPTVESLAPVFIPKGRLGTKPKERVSVPFRLEW